MTNFYNNPTVVLISAERIGWSPRENFAEHRRMIANIEKDMGLSYKEVQGVYEGVSEASIMVVISQIEQIAELTSLARSYGQKSILVLNPDRTGYLKYTDGSEEIMGGRFTASSEKPNANAYTYDPTTKLYYVFDGGAK